MQKARSARETAQAGLYEPGPSELIIGISVLAEVGGGNRSGSEQR
jgi:hypothetical protein